MHSKSPIDSLVSLLGKLLGRTPNRAEQIASLVDALESDERRLRKRLAKKLLPAQRRRLRHALEVNRLQQRKAATLLREPVGRQHPESPAARLKPGKLDLA